MASIIKSVSDTTNNVLTTVGTLASQATRTVNTAGDALDMLNSFVTTAREKQKARTALDMEEFYSDLIQDTAFKQAERELELATKINQNPQLKNSFTELHSKYSTIIDNLRNPTTEE